MKCLILIACWLFSGTTIINSYRFAAAGGFAPSSATFDGTDDMIAFSGSAITMSGAGKQVTVSFWVNLDNTSANRYIIQGRNGGSGPQWRVNCNQTEVQIAIANSSSTTVVNLDSDGNLVAGEWHHVMISVDTSNSANRHIYIDGVEAMDGIVTFTVDGILALDRTNFNVGADDSIGNDLPGCLAELWVDDSYIDFSNSANRAKFFNAGAPVDLGTTGQTPTGSSPDVYMKFVAGSLGVNSGADGGTGTIIGGVTTGDCGAVGN